MKHRIALMVGILAAGIVAGWALARTQEKANPPKAEAVQADPDAAEVAETPLHTLDWLAGDWVDASDNVNIEFSCHFTKNKAFLIRAFTITTETKTPFSGMQLIAWDPAKKSIRSWTYDSNGGFGEENWTQADNRYSIRCKYTLPDGGVGTNIQVITFVDENKFAWKSVNRVIDGEFQPDTDEIVFVRKLAFDEAKGDK